MYKNDLVTGNTCSRFLKTIACGTGSDGVSSFSLYNDDLVTGNTCSRFLMKTSACGTGSGGVSSFFLFLIKDDLVTGNTCSRFLTKTSACVTVSGGASSYPRCSPLRWASPVSSSSASSSLSSAERSSLIYCTSVPHPHYRRRIRQKVVADV